MKTIHSLLKKSLPTATILLLSLVFLTGTLSSCVDDGETYYRKDYGVYIDYKADGTVSIINPVNDGGVTITAQGHHVSVSSKANDVTYFLSGATTDGTFRITSSEHSQNVVLNGVSIKNPNGGALNILSKKTTYLVLSRETQNYLEDGGVSEIDGSKGALFCDGKLRIYGEGKLTVNGKTKHGIACDDFLEMYSGDITVTNALSDGMHVHDYIAIYGGKLTITAQSDGLDCDRGYIDIYDGNISTTTGKKGIATTSDSAALDRHIRIVDGTILIRSLSTVENDSTGYGLRSAGNMYIEGGTITIDTQKKGISAGKSISTSGEEDDDDSDVFQPQELYISGGEITCTGTVRPEVNLGTQNCIYYVQETNFSKNTTFVVTDAATGGRLTDLKNSFKIKKLFFSSPKFETGGSYRLLNPTSMPSLLKQYDIESTFSSFVSIR